MNRKSTWRSAVIATSLLAVSCVHYEPEPLDLPALVAEEEARRDEVWSRGDQVSFAELHARLLERGPSLRRAQAAYRRAEARAASPHPWPNPTVTMGPALALGREIDGMPLAPMGSLGLTIPIGDKLAALDEIDAVLAREAGVEYELSLRDAELELLRRFEELGLAIQERRLCEQLAADMAKQLEVAQVRLEAGRASAQDLGLQWIEQGRVELRLLESRAHEDQARARLASLVGARPDRLGDVPASALTNADLEAPLRDQLVEILILRHPDLARRRAAYELSEARLRLEVARQYPDLEIGFSGDDEPGEEKQVFGLTLGIELPIFDRNQKGIAEAVAGRQEAREAFQAELTTALAALDQERVELEHRIARHRLLRDRLLPECRRHLDAMNRSVEAGRTSAWNTFEARRLARQLQLDLLEAERELRLAWSTLERSLGVALRPRPTPHHENTTSETEERQP